MASLAEGTSDLPAPDAWNALLIGRTLEEIQNFQSQMTALCRDKGVQLSAQVHQTVEMAGADRVTVTRWTKATLAALMKAGVLTSAIAPKYDSKPMGTPVKGKLPPAAGTANPPPGMVGCMHASRGGWGGVPQGTHTIRPSVGQLSDDISEKEIGLERDGRAGRPPDTLPWRWHMHISIRNESMLLGGSFSLLGNCKLAGGGKVPTVWMPFL